LLSRQLRCCENVLCSDFAVSPWATARCCPIHGRGGGHLGGWRALGGSLLPARSAAPGRKWLEGGTFFYTAGEVPSLTLSLMKNNTKIKKKRVAKANLVVVRWEPGAAPWHVSFPPWSLRLRERGQRAAPGMAVGWWMLSKSSSSSSRSPLRHCPPRLCGMQSGMRSTTKELECSLWSCSGDGKGFKIENRAVLHERDVPGSSVPKINPAGFTKSSAAQRLAEQNFLYSVSSKSCSPA